MTGMYAQRGLSMGRASAGREELLEGASPVAARMRAFDWSGTPLGPIDTWSASLKTVVRMMLKSRFAMWMAWGPDLTFFCNDAYAPTLGLKQHWAIGARADKVWEEIWPDIGPRIERVFRTNQATWDEDLLLFLERSGYPEETYHTFSYSPLADDDGTVRGMLCVVTEETERVLGARRVATLRDLAAQTARARGVVEACEIAMEVLGSNRRDFPFAFIRTVDAEGGEARLVAACGIEPGQPTVSGLLQVETEPGVATALETGAIVTVALTPAESAALPRGPWPESPTECLIAPMRAKTNVGVSAYLCAGINPHRRFDAAYRDFASLVAAQIAAAIANANAHEEERRRAEALAEIDRAKTAFFSNVSHEFRTPLTLMLGPLEDALRHRPDERLEMVHRNGLRLMRLVNALLDFARAEAGRATARFEPTDLGAFTAELASNFNSAFESAGLGFAVNIEPIGIVAVDRAMWEKIVLNLISNAFKFTLSGRVSLTLARCGEDVALAVADTGVGIPREHLSRVFDRFHRIENQRGRTHEGSGIGLALVNDLTGLHGGTVAVASEEGGGTTFTVRIPARRSPDGTAPQAEETRATSARAFVEEALRWLPGRPTPDGMEDRDGGALSSRTCIVLADDNADMRAYIARMLDEAGYHVVTASDGETALEAVRQFRPALVLSDVMMPRLDGLGLAKALRGDRSTAAIPVILLSARTGEDARIEGLEAGADDYVTKPFVARELVARIRASIARARERAEMLDRAESTAAELRLAADALSESERRFRELADNSPVMIWVTDADGACTYLSRRWYEFTGQARAEGLGIRWLKTAHPEDHERLETEFAAANSRRAPFTLEYRLRRADGAYRWCIDAASPRVGEDGSFLGFVGSVIDITDRKVAEEALRAAHDTFRHLVDRSPFGIYVVDSDFRLLQVSEGAQQVFANVRPLIGRDFEEVLRCVWPEPFATHAIERFRHTLATGEAYHSPGTVERRADVDAVEAYDWKVERVVLPDGRPGAVCHFYNLTERQAHQEKIETLMREVNHRAKNMLALVEAVAKQTVATGGEDFLERFGARVRALAASQDLLVQTQWEGADLVALIESQLLHFKDLVGTRIVLDGPNVHVNPRAAQTLGMAIHELATNSAKYGALSDLRGTVSISWKVTRAGAGRQFAIRWVEGNGPPVPPPAKLGFGQRVAKSIVESELAGRVTLDYVATGVEWTLTCPFSGVVGATTVYVPNFAPRSTGNTVLLVEDDALLALDLADSLRDLGYEVVGPVASVARALELLRGRTPRLALLDINLGAETSEPVALRLMDSSVPFIGMSGYSRSQQPAIFRDRPFFTKPIHMPSLLDEIARVLSPAVGP